MLKNWYRVFYVLFSIAGIAMYISAFALMPRGESASFALVCLLLAPITFFVGTIVYNIMKSFEKSKVGSNYALVVTGLLATVLFSIGAGAVFGEYGLANSVASIDGGSDRAMWYSQILVSFAFFGQMIVFALMPFLKGVSKTIAATPEPPCRHCEPKAEPTPEPVKEEPVVVATEEKPTPKPRKPRTPKPAAE